MSEQDVLEELEHHALSRRDLMVKGGLLAAGATLLGGPAAAAFGATSQARKVKIAVVTHGDTGSFWSVFKKVDQAARDLKSRGVSVTQVYANNDVAKQVNGINAAIAAKANVIATSVPDASALKGSLTKAAGKGIEIITCNSGLGAFDSLKTYMVHVGQTEDIAGQGAGKQFKAAGAKKVLVVIHEAANSGCAACRRCEEDPRRRRQVSRSRTRSRTSLARRQGSPPPSRPTRRSTRSSGSTPT